ncbi:MAG TPA: MFS transporter [Spirochaetales bacterium]|nr:MFS transporter [Spirochaetales bacterium]
MRDDTSPMVEAGPATAIPRPRMSLALKLVFSVGQLGWSLTTFLANNLLAYFYVPPENGGEGIPAFVPRGALLGLLTVVGLAAFAARLFDGVNDPLIAGLSDRSRSRLGRRRTFMAIGAVPAVAMALAQFWPPVAGVSGLNVAWLFGTALLGTVFLTMYVMPYNALIAELGADSKDRLLLAALTSVTWAVGFASGNAVYAIKDALVAGGATPLAAFRTATGLLGAVAVIAMLVPVFAINERKYASGGVSDAPAFGAIREALRDRPFRVLVGASFLYYTANTFLEIGIAYYVGALMGLPESQAFTLSVAIFGLSFLWYPAVMRAAGRLGKKRVLSLGFVAQVFVFCVIPLVGLAPSVPVLAWAVVIAVGQSAASAAFGILPTAMVADAARAHSARTGSSIEGAYFGVNSFAMKLAVSTANLAFPSFLLLGRSAERSLGIRLSGAAAAALTLAGYLVLRRYEEAEEAEEA